MPKLRDFTGQRVGMLTVLRREGRNNYGVTWLCMCDCGKTKVVAMMNLRNGNTRSCGCATARLKSQWADRTGLTYSCIRGRFRRGLTGAALIA